MVQNYATVTDGFHQTCEGDHRQRDAEFKNQDSFRDGTVERPLWLTLLLRCDVAIFLYGEIFRNFPE